MKCQSTLAIAVSCLVCLPSTSPPGPGYPARPSVRSTDSDDIFSFFNFHTRYALCIVLTIRKKSSRRKRRQQFKPWERQKEWQQPNHEGAKGKKRTNNGTSSKYALAANLIPNSNFQLNCDTNTSSSVDEWGTGWGRGIGGDRDDRMRVPNYRWSNSENVTLVLVCV